MVACVLTQSASCNRIIALSLRGQRQKCAQAITKFELICMQEDIKIAIKRDHDATICSRGFNLAGHRKSCARVEMSHIEVHRALTVRTTTRITETK